MNEFPETLEGYVHYYDFAGFANYFLEDSWLIGIIGEEAMLEFHVQAVMNPNHPLYHPPYPGEAYCYGRIVIRFSNVKSAKWQHTFWDGSEHQWIDGLKSLSVNIDLDGSLYYGDVKHLVRDSDGYYFMEGESWRVRIESEVPTVELVNVYQAPASPVAQPAKRPGKSRTR